jgi:hypothetical protein
MSFIINRIKAAIKAAADALDDYTKMAYGTEGQQVEIAGLGTYDTGKAWLKDRTGVLGYLDLLLEEGVGKELERAPSASALINVNALSAGATLSHANGIASVSKEETGGQCISVTVTLSNAYADMYFMTFAALQGIAGIAKIEPQSSTTVKISFKNYLDTTFNLTNGKISVLCIGSL